MKHIIRTALIVNRVKLADPAVTAAQLVPLIDSALEDKTDLILTPLFSLTGAGCGRLFAVSSFQETVKKQILLLAERYASQDCPIILGDGELPVVLYRGQVYSSSNGSLAFRCGDAAVSVHTGDYRRLPLCCGDLYREGADIVLFPAYHPYKAGDYQNAANTFRMISQSLGAGLAFCNGGFGDTSSPYLYKGYCGAAEDGVLLCGSSSGAKGHVTFCDFDLDIIRGCRAKKGCRSSIAEPLFSTPAREHHNLYRSVSMDPYLPADKAGENALLDEIFDLQVKSLADRMCNTGIRKLVLGISGGLDSTLAFLAAASAVDRLSLPRGNVIAITMPGFGTSGRTYLNAVSLIKALDADFREIDITASVTQHLQDIGHAVDNRNVTYENAQARERAQILLDVANDNAALVVGTGDLSEEALGWCTFAGDHIANYNVNVCVTKTMIRKIVGRLVEQERFPDANEALQDILNSPVSPELLPPDENGMIAQKTEEILGPYELHDFFLYYFVKYGLPPEKTAEYACLAFPHITPEFIREKCVLFFRRMAGGQFKRSCAPDSAAITEVNLSAAEFFLPSDCRFDTLLHELTAGKQD